MGAHHALERRNTTGHRAGKPLGAEEPMKKRRDSPRTDFREHAFTATGKDTDLQNFTSLDLQDNLNAELHRLDALAELLGCTNDIVDARFLAGIALLLQDISRRMSAALLVASHSERGRGIGATRGRLAQEEG